MLAPPLLPALPVQSKQKRKGEVEKGVMIHCLGGASAEPQRVAEMLLAGMVRT